MKFLLGALRPQKALGCNFYVKKLTFWWCRTEIKSKFECKFLEKVGFDGLISGMHNQSEIFYTEIFTPEALWGLMAPSKKFIVQKNP